MRKRITIEIEDTDRFILGGAIGQSRSAGTQLPALSRAATCWARLMRESQPNLTRAEWNLLADVLNGSFEGDWALGLYQHGASALCLEVHDAQRLNGVGDKWLGDPDRPGSGQAATETLLGKLEKLSWPEVQYIRTACDFFWSEPGLAAIDPQRDDWWTLEFRVRTLRQWEAQQAQ